MSDYEFVVKVVLFIMSIPSPIIFVTSLKSYIQTDSKLKLFVAGISLWFTMYFVVFINIYIGTMFQ